MIGPSREQRQAVPRRREEQGGKEQSCRHAWSARPEVESMHRGGKGQEKDRNYTFRMMFFRYRT